MHTIDPFLAAFDLPTLALDANGEQPLGANASFYEALGLPVGAPMSALWPNLTLHPLREDPTKRYLLFRSIQGAALEWHATVQPAQWGGQALLLLCCRPAPEPAPPLRDWQHTVQGLQQHQQQLENEIAERERVEQELRHTQAQLRTALERERELNELKTRFIATASHEFRTPLSSILSSASLIERYPTTEQQPKRLKHVQRIQASVRNLTQILEDFLSLSALEEGDPLQHRQAIQVPVLIESVLETVRVFAKPRQQIHYRHEGASHTLYLNAQSLKNILLNLLSNGIKYSPEGATITVSSQLQAQQALTIIVQDSGMGIPQEQQKHLFTRFFRADNATAIQGTGLGLYIVKKYAEALGGGIQLESTLGQGTRVTFHLPLQAAHWHESS